MHRLKLLATAAILRIEYQFDNIIIIIILITFFFIVVIEIAILFRTVIHLSARPSRIGYVGTLIVKI